MTTLFDPIHIGCIAAANRIVMAPLTRNRAGAGGVPPEMAALYYAQRASAGLIIAEATQISFEAQGYIATPGIHTPEQVAGWRRVTDAVHAAGGKIVLQLWHVGRISHVSLLPAGMVPVSSSARVAAAKTFTQDGLVDVSPPRALRTDEMPRLVADYRHAARNAMAAGFDGVEVHGANGYLLDQFLRDGTNRRSGPYGGPLEHRARLLLEVLAAVRGETPLMGLRLSPLNSYNDVKDSDPVGLASWLGEHLNDRGLDYLHLMRGDFLAIQQGDVLTPVRERFRGPLIANMGYDAAEADAAIAAGTVDAVAFGNAFLANPDLPERLRLGAPLNAVDPSTFYSPGPAGYTDYPFLPR
jgi:N-ethylmaleimide reductase